MCSTARRNFLRFILILLLSMCSILFLAHRLQGPDLSNLSDPSPYLIAKDQLISAINNHIINHICLPHSSIVIIVETSPQSFDRRKIIRSTYANRTDQIELKNQVYFAVGASLNTRTMELIREENLVHSDIIQWNFIDSYKNLVVKSTAIINWASTNCALSRFIVKADADAYINIYKLLNSKSILANLAKRYTGKLIFGKTGNIHTVRSHNSKWYFPLTIYANQTFPNFVTSAAYIVSTIS